MATNASKIDAAAEKAYAEAAAKKADAKPATDEVNINAVAKAVEADKPDPAKKATAIKTAAKKAPAKKTAVKKTVAKPAAKKVAAKKTAAPKTAAKKTATKKAAPKRKPATAKSPVSTKDTIMTKAQTKAADLTAQAKEGLSDIQTRAKTAFDKGSEIATDMGEFTKGNVEAVVESGKILASGMQDIAKGYIAEGKTAVETMTADVKDVAAVKSPTEFVELQSKIVSRNFDATVATFSKNTETMLKLANDAFAPLSGRMSLAMEKVRKAA